jgi:transposase
VPTAASGTGKLLSGFERARVVIEAALTRPGCRGLVEAKGQECIVANPRRLQRITFNEKKTDRVDAEYLARIGKGMPQLLHPIGRRGLEAQKDLSLIRSRSILVKSRTALVNGVRSILKSFGIRLPACDAHYFHKKVEPMVPAEHRAAVVPLLAQIENLSGLITGFDKKIKQLCERKDQRETRRLQAVAGVGPLISLAFVLTLEDPERFRKSRQVGGFLGLVPRLNSSGESNPQLQITKRGNT